MGEAEPPKKKMTGRQMERTRTRDVVAVRECFHGSTTPSRVPQGVCPAAFDSRYCATDYHPLHIYTSKPQEYEDW